MVLSTSPICPSEASDVEKYEIYAAPWSYAGVGSGADGPVDPTLTLESLAPVLPVTLTQLAGNFDVLPGQEIWVAVVPVDSAGNSITSDLNVVSAIPIDDNVTDHGGFLPSIDGITLMWRKRQTCA